MFGKIAALAKDQAMKEFENDIKPVIDQNIEIFKSLKPSSVQDDSIYRKMIVEPLWTAIDASAGGSLLLVQKFCDVKTKFDKAMFDIRKDLIIVEGEKVSLVNGFQDKVTPTIINSFKN
jgi:hypothetical protein